MANLQVLDQENADEYVPEVLLPSLDGDVLLVPAPAKPHDSKHKAVDGEGKRLDKALRFTSLVQALDGWHERRDGITDGFGVDPFNANTL